jgi:enterochelin esterase-like enzyme
MRPETYLRSVMVALGIVLTPVIAAAQLQTETPASAAGAKPVTVERIKVHGAALEGNLEGNAPDRDVLVFLPPSYAKEKSRRYPVVYALHGFSIGAEQWSKETHVPQTIEGAFGQGAKEMIVVLPDSKTVHNGSMYSSSPTTGDFEAFVSRDLVAYIDAHYRILPNRASRGLVGHSMGGYGATRIGMKHADVFGSLYIMSPCCLSARGAGRDPSELEKTLAAAASPAATVKLPFFARAQLAAASAWSPNPKNPPFLPRSADEGRRAATRGARPMGGERAAGVRPSLYRQPKHVSRNRHGRWRSGRTEDRRGEAPRSVRCLRSREHVRGVRRHAHEQSRRSLPEPRTAVLQPHVVRRSSMPLASWRG